MTRIVMIGDHVGFQMGTPAGNYVALVADALLHADADVVRMPPPGGSASRPRHLRDVLGAARSGTYDAVLYYGHSTLMIAWAWFVTRGTSCSFVLHAVEWPPANRGPGVRAWVQAKFFAVLAFRMSDAVVVISAELERKVAAASMRRKRSIPTLRLPILVDVSVDPPEHGHAPKGRRRVLYCGDLVGYRDDVIFILHAFARANVSDLSLLLIGRTDGRFEREVADVASALGVADRVQIESRILSYEELLASYAAAEALLVPLSDDERSRSRFPSKLADYLLTGRPVVSSGVGEVAALLRDGIDGYLATPGSPASFAEKLRLAICSPDRDAVGAAGRRTALERLDHRRHGQRLVGFLSRLSH